MSKLFNRLNIVLALALLLATLFGFARIPEGDKLPAHWSINGAVDRFGSRDQVLILLPLAAAVVAGLLAASNSSSGGRVVAMSVASSPLPCLLF